LDETQGRPAYGQIQDDGTFKMQSSAGIPGVIPGKYQIAILAYDQATEQAAASKERGRPVRDSRSPTSPVRKPTIPKRYFDAKQSGLTDDVCDSHSRVMNIDLKD
jgi:hypothetical protein